MEECLCDSILRDETSTFSALMYRKAGSIKVKGQFLTQLCALHDAPGCMIKSIRYGAPVNTDESVMSPLHCAAFSNSLETAAILIENGARLDAKFDGKTPLEYAVIYGNRKLCKMFLDTGSEPVDFLWACQNTKEADTLELFKDEAMYSEAMETAVNRGCTPVVSFLISQGTQPPKDSLLKSCAYNFYSVVKVLLDGGEVPSQLAFETTIFWESIESMNTLVEWGMPLLDSYYEYAIVNDKPRSLRRLLELDNRVNNDCQGLLPIQLAASANGIECFKVLLEFGANVNTADILGCTPMHWASLNNNRDILQLILDNNGIINTEDLSAFGEMKKKPETSWSAIHVAVEADSPDAVEFLLDNGAKQYSKWDSNTLLHMAVDSPDIIPILMNHGGSLDAVNNDLLSPIDYAKSKGKGDVFSEYIN